MWPLSNNTFSRAESQSLRRASFEWPPKVYRAQEFTSEMNIHGHSCVPLVASGRSTFGRLQGKKAERM